MLETLVEVETAEVVIDWSEYRTQEILEIYRGLAAEEIRPAEKKWKRTDYECAVDEYLATAPRDVVASLAKKLETAKVGRDGQETLSLINKKEGLWCHDPAPSLADLEKKNLFELILVAKDRHIDINCCNERSEVLSKITKILYPSAVLAKNRETSTETDSEDGKNADIGEKHFPLMRSLSGRMRIGRRLEEMDVEKYAFHLGMHTGTWSILRRFLSVSNFMSSAELTSLEPASPKVVKVPSLLALAIVGSVYPTLRASDEGAEELMERTWSIVQNDLCAASGVGMMATLTSAYESCHDVSLFRLNLLKDELQNSGLLPEDFVEVSNKFLDILSAVKPKSVATFFINTVESDGKEWMFGELSALLQLMENFDKEDKKKFRKRRIAQLEKITHMLQEAKLLNTLVLRSQSTFGDNSAKLNFLDVAFDTVGSAIDLNIRGLRLERGIVVSLLPAMCLLKMKHATIIRQGENAGPAASVLDHTFRLFDRQMRALSNSDPKSTIDQYMSRLLFIETGYFLTLKDVAGQFHYKILTVETSKVEETVHIMLHGIYSWQRRNGLDEVQDDINVRLQQLRSLENVSYCLMAKEFEGMATVVARSEKAAGPLWSDLIQIADLNLEQCSRALADRWYGGEAHSTPPNARVWCKAAEALCELALERPSLQKLTEYLVSVRKVGEDLLEFYSVVRKGICDRSELSIDGSTARNMPQCIRALSEATSQTTEVKTATHMYRSIALDSMLFAEPTLLDHFELAIPTKNAPVYYQSPSNLRAMMKTIERENLPLFPPVEHVIKRLKAMEDLLSD